MIYSWRSSFCMQRRAQAETSVRLWGPIECTIYAPEVYTVVFRQRSNASHSQASTVNHILTEYLPFCLSKLECLISLHFISPHGCCLTMCRRISQCPRPKVNLSLVTNSLNVHFREHAATADNIIWYITVAARSKELGSHIKGWFVGGPQVAMDWNVGHSGCLFFHFQQGGRRVVWEHHLPLLHETLWQRRWHFPWRQIWRSSHCEHFTLLPSCRLVFLPFPFLTVKMEIAKVKVTGNSEDTS